MAVAELALGMVEPNRIDVSEDFAKAVRDKFRLEPRGTMQLKGKGETRTFYLMGGTLRCPRSALESDANRGH